MPDSEKAESQKPSASKAKKDLKLLRVTVNNLSDLLAAYNELEPNQSGYEEMLNTRGSYYVHPALFASDAAKLIKAHVTKLSLLIINKPFTASAVTKILTEVMNKPLPNLALSLQYCLPSAYTQTISSELQSRVKRVFVEFGKFVALIPLHGDILSDDAKNGTGNTNGRGSLVDTGVLWAACDAVTELGDKGLAWVCTTKVETYRQSLADALTELKEWGAQESDDEPDDHDAKSTGNGSENGGESDGNSFDVDFEPHHIPASDPDKLRPRLEAVLKRINLMNHMYRGAIKRRLDVLNNPAKVPTGYTYTPEMLASEPPGPKIDEIVESLSQIPDIMDELVGAFYDLNPSLVDRLMDEIFSQGAAVAILMTQNWKGEEDNFSQWVADFYTKIKAPWDGIAHAWDNVPTLVKAENSV